MFRKRVKKEFPPGTFIPTPARFAAILQLCLAFTVLFWNMSQPFLEELFAVKSRLGIYQHVMGKKSSEHELRFAALPTRTQDEIHKQYHQIQTELDKSFLSKLAKSVKILFWGIPPYEQAWLSLSILIPIFLLKKVEGAKHIVWLLPLLTVAYSIDNRWYGIPHNRAIADFYPKEEVLVNDYIREPLDTNLFKQHEQLKRGWELYLVDKWAHEDPKQDSGLFAEQVSRGGFNFHLTLLKQIYLDWKTQSSQKIQKQKAVLTLAFYLFWNFSFAFISFYSLKSYVKKPEFALK
jgi:hypothetical protein